MDQGQLLRSFVVLLISLALIGLLLFLPAGTLSWPAAWALVAALVAEIAIAAVVLYRIDPEILAARSSGFKPGTKRWDVFVGIGVIVLIAAICPVAGLDFRASGRSLPGPVLVAGHVLTALGVVVTSWAQAVNPFFEPGVRIQTERGHRVVDTGPYAHIRHPGYVGGSLFALGLALALGSVVALVPALLAVALLVYRTMREDDTLIAELPGYAAYTGRVPARWLPRVW